MKINIEINDDLLATAKRLTGITDNKILIEKALRLLITVESQKKLRDLRGRIEMDGEPSI